jgi:hypothetical protein
VTTPHPYAEEMAAEQAGWYELVRLVGLLSPQQRMQPGYYRDPDWTVRDLVAHIGTWLAEAANRFEQIAAGTYDGNDVDIDALNAALLEAMAGQPWEVAWVQANAARSQMLNAWYALESPSEDAAWWIRKAGPEHYAEHLDRLRAWVAELTTSYG